MRSKLTIGALSAAVAFLLATNPVVSEAAGQITGKDIKNESIKGKDIKNDSIKGKDINESSLAAVPAANSLTVAPHGSVQSGTFSAAESSTGNEDGYLGFAITYPRPLASPINDNKIIDTVVTPDPVHCPGVGRAAAGYLCLYDPAGLFYNVGEGYGYSSSYPGMLVDGRSVGVIGYFPVQGEDASTGGVWTVGAP